MSSFKYDILERCEFLPLTKELASLPFSCGNTDRDHDLEDFFHNHAMLYAEERLGKTYCFVSNETGYTEIIAFFTVSNDSVKTTFIPKSSTNKVQRKIPGQKHLRTYPAVLLGRLGVNKKYQGTEYFAGQQVVNYIKSWFIEEDNKTGCRFLVVDAYNQDNVLNFYKRNKFKFLYSTEEEERKEQHIPEDNISIYTRLMFLDLIHTEILECPEPFQNI